jgi:hypothetical protein
VGRHGKVLQSTVLEAVDGLVQADQVITYRGQAGTLRNSVIVHNDLVTLHRIVDERL